jgi:hypothetical protein
MKAANIILIDLGAGPLDFKFFCGSILALTIPLDDPKINIDKRPGNCRIEFRGNGSPEDERGSG